MNLHTLTTHFPHLSEDQKQKFQDLCKLYKHWNARINLISRKDMENFEIHHLLHSLTLAKFVSFLPHTKLLDLGTGGGLPGIPLAILLPKIQITLLDATQKKMRAVQDITQQLGLKNICLHVGRAETYEEALFDIVVGRAVSALPQFLTWSQKLMHPLGSLFYYTGGLSTIDKHNIPIFAHAQLFHLKEIFKESYFQSKQIACFSVPVAAEKNRIP